MRDIFSRQMNPQFEPIRQTVARQLARRGLGPVAEAAFVCAAANELAEGRFEAIRWRGGRLSIVAANSLVAHELTFLKADLIRALRQKIGAHLGWNEQTPVRLLIRVRP